MGVVLGVVAHGVNVARIVCDGVAVGVRPDVVRAWLIMARGCPYRGEGVAGRCGVSARSLEVAKIVSFAPGISRYKTHYIYKVLVHFQTKIALN